MLELLSISAATSPQEEKAESLAQCLGGISAYSALESQKVSFVSSETHLFDFQKKTMFRDTTVLLLLDLDLIDL